MIEEVRRFAKMWPEIRNVDAIFGLRENDGHAAPYLFTETGEFEQNSNSTKRFQIYLNMK